MSALCLNAQHPTDMKYLLGRCTDRRKKKEIPDSEHFIYTVHHCGAAVHWHRFKLYPAIVVATQMAEQNLASTVHDLRDPAAVGQDSGNMNEPALAQRGPDAEDILHSLRLPGVWQAFVVGKQLAPQHAKSWGAGM